LCPSITRTDKTPEIAATIAIPANFDSLFSISPHPGIGLVSFFGAY
jgi:hypothetical protein